MDFLQELYNLKSLLLDDVFPQFQYVASGIGGIAATILIVTVCYESYIKGGFDLGLALRPFCIAFVLSVFPQLVIAPLDGISQATTKWMSNICDDMKSERELLNKRIKAAIEYEEEATDVDNTDIADMDAKYQASNVSRAEMPGWIERSCMNIMIWLVNLLTHVAQVFVSFLSIIYMMLLSLTGPITFALAIIPSFRSGITSWFARYIQIMLWQPLAQIFIFLTGSIGNIILETALKEERTITSPQLTLLCVSIVSVIGLFKIPTIAEWVVESTGGTGFNAAVNKAGANSAAGAKRGAIAATAFFKRFLG